MSDWSDLTTRLPKLLHNLEAEMTLHWWKQSRATCEEMIERIKGVVSCSYEMERKETQAKYERIGWVVHNLKDADVVTRPGVCGYCGGKAGDHSEACALWSVA